MIVTGVIFIRFAFIFCASEQKIEHNKNLPFHPNKRQVF